MLTNYGTDAQIHYLHFSFNYKVFCNAVNILQITEQYQYDSKIPSINHKIRETLWKYVHGTWMPLPWQPGSRQTMDLKRSHGITHPDNASDQISNHPNKQKPKNLWQKLTDVQTYVQTWENLMPPIPKDHVIRMSQKFHLEDTWVFKRNLKYKISKI